MVPPGWVDATDINSWANRRDAQSLLPQLVRRLIHATTEQLQYANFPAGDSVQIGGWDGIAYTQQGNSFVPSGLSVWEFGATRAIKGKADSDYEKRYAQPLGVTPNQATFVFVTPRRWTTKEDWIHQKNQEKIWAEVVVHDADALEQWLELAPAVHTWFSRVLGKWTEDASDLEYFWQEWTQATTPCLNSELHLANREDAIQTVRNWLGAAPNKLTIQADSPTEAIAFLAAVIDQLPEKERFQHLSRCVLTHTEATWRYVSSTQDGLILVPTDGLPRSIPTNHHVLLPISQEYSPTQNSLKLLRLTRTQFWQALKDMGLTTERAYDLTKESKRNLPILRRLLANAPELLTPNWAKPENARSLIPALLVGAWNEDKAEDREILAKLAHKSYSEVVSDLIRWKNCSAPFVRQVGNIWQVISRQDAWRLLAPFVLKDDLEILEIVVSSVLGELDPKYDLPVDQQFAAHFLGKTVAHSGHLRQGIAETLAFLAVQSFSGSFQDISPFQERVNRMVLRLMTQEPLAWKRWASLSPFFMILAEAAPEIFLTQLEQDLEREAPTVLELFSQESTFGSNPHACLLWALEALAWQTDYLFQVTLILAKLTRLDPGGKLLNRPGSSLKRIFQRLAPQTNATFQERLAVTDALLSREPKIAWQILCSLLPSNREIIDYNHSPDWRDWKEERPKITATEELHVIDTTVDRLLLHAGINSSRWCSILEHIASLPITTQTRIIHTLEVIDTTQMDTSSLTQLWNKLRSIIHKHREYSNTNWAMSPETVDCLYQVYEQIKPQSLLHQYAWIFQHNPDFVVKRHQGWQERREVTQQAQAEAAEIVYEQGGLSALLKLAEMVADPSNLGEAIAKIQDIDRIEVELLERAIEPDCRSLNALAITFVAQRRIDLGWKWVDRILEIAKARQWSTEKLRNFCLGLPFERQTWNRLNTLGKAVETLYWQCAVSSRSRDEDSETAIRHLLAANRPYAALNLASICLHGADENTTHLPPQLLVEILESAALTASSSEQPIPDLSCLDYYVEKLLHIIEKAEDIERQIIAKLEWMYLPLLVHTERQPKLLHDELSRDPLFFVEILKTVYRSEDDQEEPVELTQAAITHARLGGELLESWHQVPGLMEDGTINANYLRDWITTVRTAAHEIKRSTIADRQIGKVLASSPKPSDGTFPDIVIRDIIEEMGNSSMEESFKIAIFNQRGVYASAIDEGGLQEREIALIYQNYAASVKYTHLRTAAMLRRIADTYHSQAYSRDLEADLAD